MFLYFWYGRKRTHKMSATESLKDAQSSSGVGNTCTNPSLENIENNKLVVDRFASLFNNEKLSDIIIQVGDERFYAHKFMLIICSEVFEAMLNEDRWKEASQPEIKLTEEEECIPVFSLFLRYIYSGSVGLTTDNVLPILLLADKYCIPALSTACVEYMTRHIVESPDTNRTLSWYQYSKMTGNSLLVDKCRKFILSNFEIILKTADWMDLSKDEVVEFLSSSDLVISNEFDLWLKLEQWLLSESNHKDVALNVKEVVPLLRFKMMQPKQLLEIEKSQLYVDHKDIFSDKINAAYRYHSLIMNEVYQNHRDEMFRNYMCKFYCLCIDLTLLHYNYVEKFESKINHLVTIPVDVVASSNKKNMKEIPFEVTFWPKGPFKTFSWYGYTSPNVTMSLKMLCKNLSAVDTSMSLILYGIKNGVKYVAFSYNATHKFTASSSVFTEDNVVQIEHLKADNSPYIVNGNLEAKLFLKIKDVEWDKDN
ncbi:BTB/POZ domain-containing protein 17-like isoform X2 [Ruditapes philippinarum]|uniref:BTB/POZ domain-containing protein 17-like isoform X2 n=1 Tax=Ruditapes philippinarum TaxID=129788 RepID=UPI00295B746A|nr:BTB/POZ domain-containing protein 17-like isoform X2 [Ruditapes philippinarum]